MKRNIIFKSFVAVAVATTLAGCDENAWNNNLDGFEDQNNAALTNVQSIEYTLTSSDYSSIASNSTNVALAGTDLKAALTAVGTRKAFSDQIPASQYVPAFLNSSSFSYFTLTDGSSVKLTYNVSQGLPAELDEAAAAQSYTIEDEDYQEVWGSDDDYISAFAPSHSASKNIPGILAMSVNADESAYCLVTYNESTQEPVFGNVNGGTTSSFEPTSVISGVELNSSYTIKGVVTGACGQGYILTDNSGSIFVYMGSSYDSTTYPIGTQLEVEGTIGAYNKGFQVTGSSATVNVVGTQEVTYPTPTVYSGTALDAAGARTENAIAVYAQISGTVAVSGSNINIVVEGAETAKGSVYGATTAQKEALTDGASVTIKGYYIAAAGSGRYCNFVVTHINDKACAKKRLGKTIYKAAAAEVPTTKLNALYYFNGSKWSEASGFVVLNDADYTAMGQTYKNLTEPAKYLPTYLKTNYPYAQADDTKNVVYTLYANSKSTLACDQYIYNGSEWVLNDGIVTETTQFVRTGGSWMYDPNVTITLPAGKGQELSTTYFQACVNWVYENICVPLGDTSIKSGKFYVSSYGNNEYYSGTSAYQGNVDIRPSAAKGQYPAEYDSMSDDEVVALMKSRFMNEVMPGALATLHPDAKPIDGIEVIYTINFVAYTGSSESHTARFKVVGQGQFEPIDCTWDAAE